MKAGNESSSRVTRASMVELTMVTSLSLAEPASMTNARYSSASPWTNVEYGSTSGDSPLDVVPDTMLHLLCRDRINVHAIILIHPRAVCTASTKVYKPLTFPLTRPNDDMEPATAIWPVGRKKERDRTAYGPLPSALL